MKETEITAFIEKEMSCKHERILDVNAKCSDCCAIHYKDIEYDGYVPSGLNLGEESGDYIEIKICLDCGKIQNGTFPISEKTVIASLNQSEIDDEDADLEEEEDD